MAKDVLITPASGLIQFYDADGNVDATIQLDDANVLNISGTVSLGDLAADVYIGDGVNEVDIVFEQNGIIYALAGKTLTLGQANSNISFAGNITSGANITGNVTGGNLITSGLITATGNITGGNIATAGQITATGNVTGNYFVGNGSQLTGINSFSTIAVSGQSSVTADSIADTLTLTAGAGITILTDTDTDTITITSVATDSIFATGGDMGTVEEAVTVEEDLGLITNAITQSYDLGTIVLGGLVYPSQLVLPSFTVAEIASLPANPVGQMVICTNEAGGTVPAFSDGTDWRRVTDRAVIT